MLHSKWQKIWKTQQSPQDWKRSVFIPIPKKGNAKECSNYLTIALISHTSKVMFKILQPRRLQQYVNPKLQVFKLDLEEAENQRSNCLYPLDHRKSKRVPEKHILTSALLTIPKTFTVYITTNWKIQEMRISDHLTWLLRNIYAGQEATVRTGHGTTDWIQIGKGIHQNCILSFCLFNFYAENIMRNAGLDGDNLTWRLPGEISITSYMQMIPSLWQKVKKN